jgi:hypothetical protein
LQRRAQETRSNPEKEEQKMKRLDLRVLDILSNEYTKKDIYPDYEPRSISEIQESLIKSDTEDTQ